MISVKNVNANPFVVSIDTLIRGKQRTCLVCISPLSSPHVLPRPEQRERKVTKGSLDRQKLIANLAGRNRAEC